MPQSREIRNQSEHCWAQFFNITFVLKSTDNYEKSLDRENDLLHRLAKKGGGREERKEGRKEERKEGRDEGERKNVNIIGA